MVVVLAPSPIPVLVLIREMLIAISVNVRGLNRSASHLSGLFSILRLVASRNFAVVDTLTAKKRSTRSARMVAAATAL